jgi:hypothetical protein
MKPIDYPDNGRGLFVQYHVMREGPNYFLVNYKNTSVLRQDPKDAWRVMGSAKFTAKSQELKQWCLDIHDKYSNKQAETRKDTSFASESQNEQEDPTANTKMIV